MLAGGVSGGRAQPGPMMKPPPGASCRMISTVWHRTSSTLLSRRTCTGCNMPSTLVRPRVARLHDAGSVPGSNSMQAAPVAMRLGSIPVSLPQAWTQPEASRCLHALRRTPARAAVRVHRTWPARSSCGRPGRWSNCAPRRGSGPRRTRCSCGCRYPGVDGRPGGSPVRRPRSETVPGRTAPRPAPSGPGRPGR